MCQCWSRRSSMCCRRATMPSMSTAHLAPAAIAGRCSPRLIAVSSRSIAIPMRCGAAASWRAPMAGGSPSSKGISATWSGCWRRPGSITPAPIAGIALDLGVSSIQLDSAERGFSFRFDGPLDMRMSGTGQTAADLVATLAESDLARLIREFGEERFARRIARAIAAARRRQPIRPYPRTRPDRAYRGAQGRARARPGDPHLSGAAHRRQRRARRTRSRARRGRTAADARRTAGHSVISFARRSAGQGLLAAAQRQGASHLAPRAGPATVAAPSFQSAASPGAQTGHRGNRPQSACTGGAAARGGTHRRPTLAAAVATGNNGTPHDQALRTVLVGIWSRRRASQCSRSSTRSRPSPTSWPKQPNGRTTPSATSACFDAEWAYLNRPDALAQMNQRYLSLAPIATKQLIANIADIPMRPSRRRHVGRDSGCRRRKLTPAERIARGEPSSCGTAVPRPAVHGKRGPRPDRRTRNRGNPTPEPARPAPIKAAARPNSASRAKSLDELIARIAENR